MNIYAVPKAKRFEYIDIAKAIGIFLVIMGHELLDTNVYRRIIYSFHIPLFFFLSGLVFKTAENESLFQSVKKRFYGIYVPYIIWACFYSSAGSLKNLAYVFYGTREALSLAKSTAPLWYLEVLFVADVIVLLFLRFVRKLGGGYDFRRSLCLAGCICFGIIGVMIPHPEETGNLFAIDNALVAAAFILLGFLLKKTINTISQLAWKKLGVVCIVISVLFLTGEYLWQKSSHVTMVIMSRATYGNLPVFLILSIAGISCTLSISMLISKIPSGKALLLYIGQNTLGILVVHNKIIRYFAHVAKKHGYDNNNLAVAILLSAACLAISTVIVFIIRKIVPELLGGHRK